MPNREDGVLDEIAELVDWQLRDGDQSDSFHGAGFRHNHPCPWCGEGWHFLPITEHMQAMRAGSYATDEFGAGIVDPDYRYEDDTSGVVCPGSEFHGPEHKTRMWDKQRRERIESHGETSTAHPGNLVPSLPPGPRRILRFIGPFEPWIIALDDERVMEDIISDPALVGLPGERRRVPIVVEQRLTATFELAHPLRDMPDEWVRQNQEDIEEMTFRPDYVLCHMRAIVIPFAEIRIYAANPRAPFPDYVEFLTTYRIENHPWFMQYWQWMHICCEECVPNEGHCACGGNRHPLETEAHLCCRECSPGIYHHLDHIVACQRANIVTIDETHEHTDEDLRRHVQDATTAAYHYAAQTAHETLNQGERGPTVLRRGEEAEAGQDRQVDARAQPREVQTSARPTLATSECQTSQAESEG